MSVHVLIPTPLRRFTGDEREVAVEAGTVDGALAALVERHPKLKPHLYGDDGRVRSFVNVFVNDDNIRHGEGGATAVGEGDTVSIIPSIAGWARMTGYNTIFIDDRDPFAHGFVVK